ncbi:MAG TPA: 1,4-alpha-glucan branching protein domain-containing protein [Solirubrobacterales bacterium]|jgi:1,4-alpha-glucan branching enzyme|nr:1,4-alpha-glucan branching protein domain-containing protein [Solirubrobacterales bacterium]
MTQRPGGTPFPPHTPPGIGDLAIVLHSHMPYVEGFGTYPFGEEWLFDAVIRSYLPVLEVAERLTMTVTPVLADQLEDPGAAERLRKFLVEWRIGAAEADVKQVPTECRQACEGELARYRHALELLDAVGGDPLRAFQAVAGGGRVALATSAATHAVLPLLATQAGARLQIDAGIRSHRRRFGWDGGFWLPECAYAPGLERRLEEHGVRWFCVDQSRHEPPLDALTPVASAAGPTALPIDWAAIQWLWSLDGYPSDPAYAQFAGKSLRGVRIWKVGGGAYEPAAAAAAARRHAAEFLGDIAARLGEFAAARGRRGLLVFAIDTELLGHWWSEGAIWLREVLAGAAAAGVRLLTVPEALVEHEPEARPLAASTWGEGKDLSTWDSPAVADLAWAARRLELRLLRELSRGLAGPAALRAARELLAVQSSDWAFLDKRGQAGDYAFQRATAHAESLMQAIDSPAAVDPRMRALAPDLSLASLLEP